MKTLHTLTLASALAASLPAMSDSKLIQIGVFSSDRIGNIQLSYVKGSAESWLERGETYVSARFIYAGNQDGIDHMTYVTTRAACRAQEGTYLFFRTGSNPEYGNRGYYVEGDGSLGSTAVRAVCTLSDPNGRKL